MNLRRQELFERLLETPRPVRVSSTTEWQFEANLKKVDPAKGETRAEVEEYFRDKYERLIAFLRQAIDRKESVQCSL